MTVVLNDRADFTLDAFRRVTVTGEGVVIGAAAVRAMAEARAGFERLLRADPHGFIYGVTTRPGVEVGTVIPPEERLSYARSFRGTGRGFGREYLDPRVVRGIIFARLADFVGGHAKVRPELARRVAALLAGPLPQVPLDGQQGAGEVLPLMHVMAPVDGDLAEGEGMALLNGSPCATALTADVALHAGHRLRLAEAIFALSVEAFRAPLDAYDEALDGLRGDEADRAVLRRLRGHLRGAEAAGRLAHQAPVSYRIIGQVLAPAGFVAGASGGATNLFGWVATGLVEDARAAAAPTLLPASINDTQNDIASPVFGAYRTERRAAECLDGVLAILALVASQALFAAGRDPAPPLAGLLAGIRSVFPPLEAERAGQGAQAGELAGILSRAALTGRLDLPGHLARPGWLAQP